MADLTEEVSVGEALMEGALVAADFEVYTLGLEQV